MHAREPWTIIVVEGDARNKLSKKMAAKFDAGDDGKSQYVERPSDSLPRMDEATADYERRLYEDHFNLAPDDKAGRRAKDRQNCEFWGAPIHLILCSPYKQTVEDGVDGIPLDMGTLLTAILFAAHSYGLGSIPQFTTARYHDCCREVLGNDTLPDDLMVTCGLSIGWPTGGRDPRAHAEFVPKKLSVADVTNWSQCDTSWLTANAGAAGDGKDHTLIKLIQGRHCSHTLEAGRSVSKDILHAILDAACNAHSIDNSQPWSVTVVQGAKRDELSKRMLEQFDAGFNGGQTYKKYAAENTPQMQKGKDTYGQELYEKKHGLARDDVDGRRLKYRPNYEFWGAPLVLLLKLPKKAVSGTFIDIGSFMYSILLAMHAYGLGGKPLGSTAKYTDICREVLGIDAVPEHEHLICGLCIGWPTDGRDPREMPDFFPSRLTLQETCRWDVDSSWSAQA